MPFLRFVIENTCISKIMQINQRVREAFDAIRLKWGLFFRPSKAFLGKGGRLVLFAGTLFCRLEKAKAT